MGKLIKNHWARLIVLTAAACKYPALKLSPTMLSIAKDPPKLCFFFADQIAAALEGFFWPKVFWDFLTKNLDGAVRPVPALQILNLVLGILGLAWEWPLSYISGTAMHRSIEARLVVYPLSSLVALLLYQGTNPGIYYLVGMGVYFWAYSEGEVG